uniref:Receptor expression-enhancing protein n=1 Tax=Anolis carolinensis TaxID=28377 RepID=G1KLF8_ANOCA
MAPLMIEKPSLPPSFLFFPRAARSRSFSVRLRAERLACQWLGRLPGSVERRQAGGRLAARARKAAAARSPRSPAPAPRSHGLLDHLQASGVKWMMYWIIFALFTTAETFTDIFLCWFPFYYELKIAFVAWLLSPYTKGSSLLYRKFVHPTLSSKEKEIDDCLVQAKDRSYDALVHFGKRGLNVAATAAVMAASKSQGALSERLRSFSMQDLTTIRGESSSTVTPSPPPPPAPSGSVRSSSKESRSKASKSASDSIGRSGTA